MAGTLGDQFYLRKSLGAIRPPRKRRRYQPAMDQARCELAQVETESRWRMGREPALGQGSGVARTRDQHRLANRVGVDRIDRGRRRAQRTRDAWRRVALRAAERRRRVDRAVVHWKRFSESFLSSLPYVSSLLSADSARTFPPAARGDCCRI